MTSLDIIFIAFRTASMTVSMIQLVSSFFFFLCFSKLKLLSKSQMAGYALIFGNCLGNTASVAAYLLRNATEFVVAGNVLL